MQYDNPASRLLSILVNGKKIAASDTCRRVWATLLETPEGDAALLVSRIGKLMGLPQEIIQQTRDLFPNQLPTWNHWLTQVNLAFSAQNLNAKWETFIQHIDDHTINYLTNATELLEAKSRIKSLDSDLVKDFRRQIDDLLREIIDSDFDAEIKRYIRHHLKKILDAIDEYKITGALPILDAIESTFGHAYLHSEYRDALRNTDIGKRVLETLATMADFVTVAVGLPQLVHVIQQLTASH